MSEFLYGRNAARECLRARRRHVYKVLMADNLQASAIIGEILGLARQFEIPIQRAPRKTLDRQSASHQGVALEVGRYPTVTVGEILNRAEQKTELPFIVVADHIEDPHNLGAILRTAEIVGVHGVIIPKQRAVGITPAVVNASAGAAEHILVAEVPNLVQALKQLKQQDIWVAGVENDASAGLYTQANLGGAIAIVMGSESKGMSRLVKETCDFLVKLPMRGQVESLNASVAGGVVLYEVWRARGFG
jgi:23S rRNA (guanosine2251-2'-O)-methyltransferase